MNQQQKTVLIIEDEAALLDVLSDKLSSEGYLVIKTSDGRTGLNMAINRQPDLIMLDVSLPVLGGIDVLKQLRSNENTQHIEVILLTNSSDSGLLAEALMLGAHDYLVKSDWQLSDIVKLVESKIGK